MIPHKTIGSGISGTVRYVLGEGKRDPVTGAVPELAPGAQSRVAWYGGTGFGFAINSAARLEIARGMMEWAAQRQESKTRECHDDCLHLSLAWNPEERPTRAEMEAAAHSALKHLGMAGARAIFVAHTDTDHPHLHLVISRIDPSTGKAFPDRFDTLALSAWALQWERDHGGVRCAARLDRERQQAEPDPDKVLAAFTGRRETFTAFDLNRELTKAIPSRDTRRAFIGAALNRPEMVRLADPENGQVLRYTTRQTLAAEHLASGSAERLAAMATHRVSGAALQGVIEKLQADGKALRDDQMQALRHTTRAGGLAVIAGKAGTGKSFAMSAIAAAYQAEGHTVQALAPTNKVASALKRDGLDGATLHSVLGRLDRGQAAWDGKTVVMVDEAGMVSTRLMARLLSHAEYAGAKVILVGDDKQLASMERGGLFGYLAAQYGAGALDEITRQRGAEQRELARRASQYDFQAALTALDAQGGVVSCATPEARIAKAAELWGQRSAAAPDSSLFVITVSNADAAAVNLAIREIRRGRGDLGPDCLLPTADGPQAFATGDRILFSGTAATREGRSAGLVNGNAGVIETIAGDRMTVALDGARPGDTVTFTVGPDREGGAFDAIRHGYAGTIYKAQGATYDHAIVVDSPMMRASSGYVALTRHRDSVAVITAPDARLGPAGWQSRTGGIDALTAAQRAGAETSYAAWHAGHPAAGQRHDFADYVTYVQRREAERRARSQAPGQPVAEMAARWSRVEDRRAASRFAALDYEPPAIGKLDPAAVRAAVGIETFEQDQGQGLASARSALPVAVTALAQPQEVAANENLKPRIAPGPSRESRAMAESPTDDELKKQVDLEATYLQHLQEHHERAQAVLAEQERAQELDQRAAAYQQGKALEAEEGRKQKAEQDAAEARAARNGDISSAAARYSIAIGETYDVRDPYASLARAAGAEAALFHKNQEHLRAEAAQETDPAKRQAIELRRQIEGCEYMAITSERLIGISTVVTGNPNNKYAVRDRQQAAHYRAMAEGLREERSNLLDKEPVITEQRAAAVQSQDAKMPPAPAPGPSPPGLPQPHSAPEPTRPPTASLSTAAPVAPQPQPEPVPVAAKAAAPKPAEPLRPPAYFVKASFDAVPFQPYAVTMPKSAILPQPAPLSPTAPFDVSSPAAMPEPKPAAPVPAAADKSATLTSEPPRRDRAEDGQDIPPPPAKEKEAPINAPASGASAAVPPHSKRADNNAKAHSTAKPVDQAKESPRPLDQTAKKATPEQYAAARAAGVPMENATSQAPPNGVRKATSEQFAAARAANIPMESATPRPRPDNVRKATPEQYATAKAAGLTMKAVTPPSGPTIDTDKSKSPQPPGTRRPPGSR